MTDKFLDPSANDLSVAFPELFGAGAQLAIIKLAGDASSRRYYRVSDAGTRRSFVLQAAEAFRPAEESSHLFLSARTLLENWGVPVPRVFARSPERGWILQEDLGDLPLQGDTRPDFYDIAIDYLVAWTLASLKQETTPHFRQYFDEEKLSAEMRWTADYLVEKLLGADPQKFLAAVAPTCRWLDARPRFWCHRDYHARNLMLSSGRPVVIDFQDARMGPMTYDLASLLWDPYVPLPESERSRLLERWRSKLENGFRKAGREDLARELSVGGTWGVELERMKVQRLLKAAGSYASFLYRLGRKDYLPSVRPALKDAVASIRALGDGELLKVVEGWELKRVDEAAR